eukprot:553445_1
MIQKFVKTGYNIHRRFITSEIVNFSERTWSWIVGTATSHMISNENKYSFDLNDVKISNETAKDVKGLISCSKQATSQWYIHKMLNDKYYIHSFADKPTNFDYIKSTFRLSNDCFEDNNILYDNNNDIRIEKACINELNYDWIKKNNYNEYFDIIIDELACDNIVTMDVNNYVYTTIYGLCLKQSGIIYVVDRKITGDMAGIKLREKIGKLYPNRYFELIGERDTPWTTQFAFLKIDSCWNLNTDRDENRIDVWGDGHKEYVQNSIKDNSNVMKNAGRGMMEGMDAVKQKLGIKIAPPKAPGSFDGGFD